jgi:putative DNA primase/helicase
VALPPFTDAELAVDHPPSDWNDYEALHGLGAVKQAITSAAAPARGEHQPGNDDAPAGEYARDVSLIRASDVTPEAIAWLWDGWLAAGKMHVFGGAPGTGKTTIAMALAATVTTGGRWPDGTRSIAGNVVIWSGEDDPADTLIPRLALSGADLSRVYFIADIREGNERRSFDPARDMEPLRRKLAEIGGVKLLIVDPVVSAIAGDSHKNAEVRRGLQPLVDLAGSMRCALLGITHFSKGTSGRDPVERLTGSLAFGALARVVLVAAKHQEEGEDGRTVRLFCRAKSNIGPDDGGFEYDLHQAELKTHPGIFASSVLWGEAVEGAARELLATADATGDDGEGGTLADVKRFLADLLADGPLPTKTIKADAGGAGYSWATIRRAQKALGIEPVKEGMKAGWVWRMPGQEAAKAILENAKMLKNAEDAQQKEVSTFGEIEHLQQNPGAVEVEI